MTGALDERLRALGRRFVDAASGQADELNHLIETGDEKSIRRLAHGLAGRAGMFGFGQLGTLALAVDEADALTLGARARELEAALRTLGQER